MKTADILSKNITQGNQAKTYPSHEIPDILLGYFSPCCWQSAVFDHITVHAELLMRVFLSGTLY